MVARTTTSDDAGVSTQFTVSERKLIKSKWFAENGKEGFYDEFLLFARSKRLSPLTREVLPLFFWDGKSRQFRMTPYTSIDGMRLIADRSKQYAGSDDYLYDGELSQYDFLNQFPQADARPKTATVTVYKMLDGVRCPFTATASCETYYPGPGKPSWSRKGMGLHMLGKCAESLALSKAFPGELSGLYIAEEMDQATTRKPWTDLETRQAPATLASRIESDPGNGSDSPPAAKEPEDTDEVDWSDGKVFKARFYEALTARGIGHDKAKLVAGAEARNNKLKNYASASPEQRESLVAKVLGGAMDGFAQVKAAEEGGGDEQHIEDENFCVKFWMEHAGIDAAAAIEEMSVAVERTTKSSLTFADMTADQMKTWRETLTKHGEVFVAKWHKSCTKEG